MSLRQTIRIPIVLSFTAAVACGAPQAADPPDISTGTSTRDVVIGPQNPAGNDIALGAGWDATQTEKGLCMTAPTVTVGTEQANIHLERSFTQEQAEQALDFGVDLKVRAGLYNVAATSTRPPRCSPTTSRTP